MELVEKDTCDIDVEECNRLGVDGKGDIERSGKGIGDTARL